MSVESLCRVHWEPDLCLVLIVLILPFRVLITNRIHLLQQADNAHTLGWQYWALVRFRKGVQTTVEISCITKRIDLATACSPKMSIGVRFGHVRLMKEAFGDKAHLGLAPFGQAPRV